MEQVPHRRLFYRAESRRLSNSKVECRPLKPEAAGSNPASDAVSCPSFLVCTPAISTGRRIGLSLHKREVAGSSPASGHQCRSSSGVERVTSQFVFYPSVSFSGPKIMGYRTLQVGGSYPSSRFDASSSIAERQCYPDRSLPAALRKPAISDGPKTLGYLSLVRLQSGAPYAPVAKWYSNSHVVPCPSIFQRLLQDDSRVKQVALCTIVQRRASGYCRRSSLPKRWRWGKRQQINMNETIPVRPGSLDKPP